VRHERTSLGTIPSPAARRPGRRVHTLRRARRAREGHVRGRLFWCM